MVTEVVTLDDDHDDDSTHQHGVVDLTGDTGTRSSSGGVRDDEVQFIRTTSTHRRHANFESNRENGVDVEFVGTKRPRSAIQPNSNFPTNLNAAPAASMQATSATRDDSINQHFNAFGRIPRMFERRHRPRPVTSASVAASNIKRSKVDESSSKIEETTAMTKGKKMQLPHGYEAIDMYYPRLKASDRTLVLHNLVSHFGCTKKFVHDWRVKFEQNHSKSTLWELAKGLSEEIARLGKDVDATNDSLDQKLPANPMDGKENKPTSNNLHSADHTEDTDEASIISFVSRSYGMHKKKQKTGDSLLERVEDKLDNCANHEPDKKLTASIGPLSGSVIDTLTIYFNAHLEQRHHKAMLEAIEPVTDSDSTLSCCICSDEFEAKDTVACCGEDIHFYCKPCLASYCTVTVQSGPVQSMSCPMPDCKSLFATHDIKSILSKYDILNIEHRENSRDRRVALAAKAMLHCECGMVAIITEEDMGNGRIECPGDGCGKRFCAKCGNDDHGQGSCPPPVETVQWLDAHSKQCPNCSNRIEKNGGCDHMTCHPPGGCGYEFWWTCGCPYKEGHKCENGQLRRPW
jgi:hypothetical protein